MSTLQRAYLGHQCFWGESAWAKLKGVRTTRVGYAGGTTVNPTYRNIGDHTEIIEVQFEPTVISYKDVLAFFWNHHNPSERRKKQYQSAILFVNDEQRDLAYKSLREAADKYKFVETYVQKLDTFYQAEDYHQKYWLRNKKSIFEQLKLTDEEIAHGELATKLNAYAAAYDDFSELEELKVKYKLSDSLVDEVTKYAKAGGDPRNCH